MTIFEFLKTLVGVIDNYLVPLIFAVAFLVFIWGVFNYFILGGGNQEKREEGKKFILYAIGGFVIILAIWGIVNLLVSSLGFDTKNRPPLPTFGTEQSQSPNTPSPITTGTTGNTTTTGGGTVQQGASCVANCMKKADCSPQPSNYCIQSVGFGSTCNSNGTCSAATPQNSSGLQQGATCKSTPQCAEGLYCDKASGASTGTCVPNDEA